MTDPPRPVPVHRHIWDRGPLPDWLTPDQYWFDRKQIVVRTPDSHARPMPGWWLIGWDNGWVTVCSPTMGEREYGPDGLYSRLAQAEESLARFTALYEAWVEAGSPPPGQPFASWWEARLWEMREAVFPS
ncbi:hypothetical protein [Streptomyces griseorubiginosus]|uniref:hypothetical protein n=1 Tax=Streptomyces griseorubiginosus TaxID=67304 RepID=UPI0036E15219